MNKTELKLQYFTPELHLTELTAKDVLLASKVEQRREVIIDDGDWSGDLIDSILNP